MELKKTPLHAAHLEAGARMVPFAGYDMPVQYSGLVDEHQAVRNAVGLFDVSHMGEVEFVGERALETANRIVTNDLTALADGQAAYTVMVRPDGGIIDDLVAYRFSEERVLICVNAANREKDYAWMEAEAKGACAVLDRSDAYVQIAVQGPRAVELVGRIAGRPVDHVKTYHFVVGDVAGREAIVSRTGYTGEDGFELYVDASDGRAVWDALMHHGEELGVKPAGLGARNSLRLEMCFALYGQDITEQHNPYEAGLGWVVKLDKGAFVGREALVQAKAGGPQRKLVPLVVTGRGIARPGYPVFAGEREVGAVTSGTHGPSVEKAIGLAYVPAPLAKVGTPLEIEVRGRRVSAEVVSRPFLKRA